MQHWPRSEKAIAFHDESTGLYMASIGEPLLCRPHSVCLRQTKRGVAVLGLIYVTIRSIALSQGHSFIEITKGLRGELLRIRELLHDEFVEHHKRELTEALEVVDRAMIKGYIDGFFLGIVSLICLFVLFTELSSGFWSP